jgi:CRISPR/Cas system-associated exonuclease Cas4 (RecB family)
MNLPETFSFNQQNLEDFQNCRKLFYLRHILNQDWPALESEPVREHEELMRLGEQFHRLVYQQGIGIPAEFLNLSMEDAEMEKWHQEFTKLRIDTLPGEKFYEKLITVPFGKYRMLAKYDLLIYTPDHHALVFDWKTSQREPQRRWLVDRMQTLVYPLVLALKSEPPTLQPQDIEMTYWYPAFPNSSIKFIYSPEQFQSDREKIAGLITEIESLEPDQFVMTNKAKLCEFCRYRSLCERGEKAGDFRTREEDDEISSPFDFDFEELPTGE